MPGEVLATIRGLPNIPTITEVNVRSGPSVTDELIFKVPVGMSGLDVLEIRPDRENRHHNGKIYQWFKLRFPGGAVGWVRDDLLYLQGDATSWGYPDLFERTWVFAMQRQVQPTHQPAQPIHPVQPSQSVQPVRPVQPSQPAQPIQPVAQASHGTTVAGQGERVKRVAFGITAAFEGTGYKAYNNYDAGIVSYGLIQFTLAAGALFSVVDRYVNNSTSHIANQLRVEYHTRIHDRDVSLRHDGHLKNLLLAAADEPAMREAQDYVATVRYWDVVVANYIEHRQMVLPLTWALLFDMGVNFGTSHGFVRLAEQELGVTPRSIPGQNGITEQQLMTRVAELRKRSHDRQAERDNLPGLRVRGDFWVNLIKHGDWGMTGAPSGSFNVNGRIIRAT